MRNSMLGNIVLVLTQMPEAFLGAIYDLLEKLAGKNGMEWFEEFKKFLRKEKSWLEHIIDFEPASHIIPPSLNPSGWEVREEDQITSRFRGRWTWNPKMLRTFLFAGQQDKTSLKGFRMRTLLQGERVPGAPLLHYLLANPYLIPEEWKRAGQYIFFWGTIYRYEGDHYAVPYLYWSGTKWDWAYFWFDRDFDRLCPALLFI